MDIFTELTICLSGTWLSESNVYNMKITGYVTHMIYRSKTHHKAKRASGGMACFIREDLHEGAENINNTQNIGDRFWLRLQAKFLDWKRYLCLFSLHKPRIIHPRILTKQHLEYTLN